jgi:hypothetical protein
MMSGRNGMSASGFFRKIKNPAADPSSHVPENDSYNQRRDIIAKIIKSGKPGTDTAGHTCLLDSKLRPS